MSGDQWFQLANSIVNAAQLVLLTYLAYQFGHKPPPPHDR